ncbi:DoxX family protein [Oceanobacillus rekensis]|uniref:DoxX family protein n=1 Tax=Oceanobacillus rekensis TaxID=937927 RepID=UPI000B43F06B|nr:DoxX family protein [Oceanobacillus rekensis]
METTKWICYAIGYVFVTAGIMKLVNADFKGVFFGLGLPFPEQTLFLVAIVELACGMLIIGRMYMKIAVPPLLLIMLGALYFSKLPILWTEGLLSFAMGARLDIVMIILLLLLWQNVRRAKIIT